MHIQGVSNFDVKPIWGTSFDLNCPENKYHTLNYELLSAT